MIQIRRATLKDEARVITLIKLFPEGEIVIDWNDAKRAFREIVQDETKGCILVAEQDGVVEGCLNLSFPHAVRCGGRYSCIEEFMVGENLRGKGIGGKLLENAIKETTARGCYELQVNRPSMLGYPVYIRYGFVDHGKHLNLRLPRQAG
ncbi:MAG: GNAT family N-acetyltransferase [Dehalococcoidales bacterium]|nr:GNAT family N-acetyltransferase [Dehalococcoidales bacterium]